MNRWNVRFFLITFAIFAFAERCPAPLIFTPGEGWRYERAGIGGSWTRPRAKDQLEVAQTAFDAKDYGTAMKAAPTGVSATPCKAA